MFLINLMSPTSTVHTTWTWYVFYMLGFGRKHFQIIIRFHWFQACRVALYIDFKQHVTHVKMTIDDRLSVV